MVHPSGNPGFATGIASIYPNIYIDIPLQNKIKKEQERIIETIQQQDSDLRQKNSRLQGLRSQLSRDKKSVEEAKDDLRKAERDVSSAKQKLQKVNKYFWKNCRLLRNVEFFWT